jgi:hypothetical protein
MRQLVTFLELSNDVDITGTGSMRVVSSRSAIPYGFQRRFKTQYGRQPPTGKIIRFWDNKLRTTGSLWGLISPGKARTSVENINRIK